MALVSVLVYLLVLAVIIYAVQLVLGMVNLPPPVITIVWLIVAVLAVVAILGVFRGGFTLPAL